MEPTLLIVDDHAEFRRAAGELLGAEGFRVVGEAADAGEAMRRVRLLHPDVVLLDIQLPGIDGLTVAQQLANLPNPPAVVLISSRSASAYRRRLERSPARGFLPKSALSGSAIRTLLGQ